MNTALLISALGGAAGALIFRSLLKAAGKFWAGRKPLAVYHCADAAPRPGSVRHSLGQRVIDERASNKQAWEHTTKSIDEKRRQHTIYGPYMNDFGKPGLYRVEFRIFASGFERTRDPVVVLDVIKAPFGTEKDLIILGQRVVRAEEFSNSKYKSFQVYLYSVGSGVYEYRCSVVPQTFDENRHTVRFDTIKVYRYIPTWEVL